MTWPSTTVPATAPTTHGPVRTQAYQAGGGDYFRTGYYSHGIFNNAAMTAAALATGKAYLRPWFQPVRRAFDRIGVNASVASGGTVHLGVYSTTGGLPVTQLLTTGGLTAPTGGGSATHEVTISLTLDPGLYWLAILDMNGSTTWRAYASMTTPWGSSETTPPTAVGPTGWAQTGLSSLPATFSASAAQAVMPAVCLRAA